MKKLAYIAITLIMAAGLAYAGGVQFSAPSVKVQDIDGDPSVTPVTTLRFTNGTVAVDGTTATVTVSGVSPGSGSVTTVDFSDDGVQTQVGDADIVTLNFGIGFDIAEAPDTEADITLDLSPGTGSATLVAEDDALQVKYDSTLTEGASGLGLADDQITNDHFANDDWGDVSVSGGTVSLDADVVAAAEMADADHGMVSWTGGAATVEDFALDAAADAGDVDITSLDKLEGVDNAVFIDMGANALLELQSDGSIQFDTPSLVLTTQVTDLDLKTAETAALTIDDDGTPMVTFDTSNDDIEVDVTLIVDGTLDANGVVALGDGGDNFSVASDGIDIDTSGNISNAGTIGTTGDLTMTSTSPDVLFVDSTTSGEAKIVISDGAGPDGIMDIQVDEAGTLASYIQFDGANETVDVLKALTTASTADLSAGTVTLGTVDGTIDAGGATALEIPNGTSDPASTTGSIALDTDGDGGEFDGPTITVSTSGATMGYAFLLSSYPGTAEDDYIIKYNAATDTLGWEADASAGTTAWSDIAAPTADKAFSFDDNEITSFTFADTNEDMFSVIATGAFGDVSVVKIDQNTGNATDGTMLEIATDDAQVDHLLLQFGANDYVTHKIVDAGTYTIDVTSDGTAAVDVVDGLTAGTITSDATVTAGTDVVIGDAGNIGSASDTDAIAISAGGEVTLTQELQAGAGIDVSGGTLVVGTISGTMSDGTASWNAATQTLAGFTSTTSSAIVMNSVDTTGAADMDYGSPDVTDHTFQADGGTAIIDGSFQFPDADGTPSAAGELQYDNTVTGLEDGALVWYDDDEARYLVDLDTLPVDNGYVVAYNATNDNFEMVSAGAGDVLADGSVPFTGDVAINSATPALTFTDTDSADGTATLSFQATGANEIVASLQTDEAGTPTTYIELDGVTTTVDVLKDLAIGANPADAGTGIRMSNNSVIEFEDSENTGEVTALQVDASEAILIGDPNASGVTITPNVTLAGTLTDGTATLNSGALSGVSTLGVSDAITLSDGATVDQSANNYIDFAENSDTAQLYFGGTDVDLIWSDGALNIRNAEDGVDAIVEIEGKDAGEKGELRVLSDGDDKYVAAYHNDTDAVVAASSGDIRLAPDGDTDDYAMVSTATNVTSISVTGGTGTLGTAAAEWNAAYFGDSSVLYFQADQSVTLTSSATGLESNLDIGFADGEGIELGTSNDWKISYDETTDDRLEFVNAVGSDGDADVYWDLADDSADTTFTITNSDGTYQADLVVEGKITSSSTSGGSYVEMSQNDTAPTLATNYGFAFVGTAGSAVLKFYEEGSWIDPITDGDSPTWTGTHDFSTAGASITLPSDAADASGEISMSTGNQLKWHDGSKVVTIDTTTTTDNYVLKYDNATATFNLEADATGGSPAWNDITGVTSSLSLTMESGEDTTFTHEAGAEFNYVYNGAFSTGSQFRIAQTGTGADEPTGGVLFEVEGDDDSIVLARFGDTGASHYWQISETASNVYTLANSGSAIIDIAAASDLQIGSAQIDYDDMAGSAAVVTSDSVDITGATGLILENDETITNDTDGEITLTASSMGLDSTTPTIFLNDTTAAATGAGVIEVDAATNGQASTLTIKVDEDGGDAVTYMEFDGPNEQIDVAKSLVLAVAPSLAADSVDAITEIAAALKSGSDTTLITGTAGTNTYTAVWNADGDLVDGYDPASKADVAGDSYTGTHNFGGADDLEVPNGANPTTDTAGQIAVDSDDDFIEFYGSGERVVGAVICESYTIVEPDEVVSIEPNVPLKQFVAEGYPHGVTFVSIHVGTDGTDVTDDSINFERWTGEDDGTPDTMENIDLTGVDNAEDDGTIANNPVADDYFVADITGWNDDIPLLIITACYYTNAGD